MADVGTITQTKADALKRKKVHTIGDVHRSVPAPYFTEYARRWLEHRYGDGAYDGGLRVTTSADLNMEKAAEQAIRNRLPAASDPWAALVAIDPRTGQVRAMAGRPKIKLGDFDPAIDAHRQTGSAFKAFTLSAAFQQHISPNSYWNGPPQITIPNPAC